MSLWTNKSLESLGTGMASLCDNGGMAKAWCCCWNVGGLRRMDSRECKTEGLVRRFVEEND